MEWYVTITQLVGLLLIASGVCVLTPAAQVPTHEIQMLAPKAHTIPLPALALLGMGGVVATIGMIGSILVAPTIWNVVPYGW